MVVVIWAIVGVLAGFIAWLLASGRGFGLFGGMIVGFVGAAIASWALPRLGFMSFDGVTGDFASSAIGAGALLALATLRVRPNGPGAMFMGFRPR